MPSKLWKPDSKLVAKVIPATKFSAGRNGKKIMTVILHSAETSETTNSAEGTAGFFHGGSGGASASTHYVLDIDGIIQCVQEKDRAFGAVGFNYVGIHIEQAGRAAQTKAQWGDAYSSAMITNQTIPLLADICTRRKTSPVFLRSGALLAGNWDGITTHAECTKWAKAKGIATRGHTDPGKDYPIITVIAGVRKAMGL